MLKIRKKRLVLSALVATGFVVPAGAFAMGHVARVNDSYADGIDNAATGAGFNDRNLYGCVIRSYNKDNGMAHPLERRLSDSELAQIRNLECQLTSDKTYAIRDYTGLIKLTNLETMDLSGQTLTNVKFPGFDSTHMLSNLTVLKIADASLTEFSIGCFPNLQELDLHGNSSLTSLDLTSGCVGSSSSSSSSGSSSSGSSSDSGSGSSDPFSSDPSIDWDTSGSGSSSGSGSGSSSGSSSGSNGDSDDPFSSDPSIDWDTSGSGSSSSGSSSGSSSSGSGSHSNTDTGSDSGFTPPPSPGGSGGSNDTGYDAWQ